MKKLIKLLLVSFVILSLTGCSKPNEEVPNNENVVGDIESSKENNEDKTTDNEVTKDENNSNKEEVNNTQNNKPVTPNKNNNTTTNKNEPSKNNTVTHTHEWTEVYEIVKHDEIGHYETVVVQEAYDERVLVQEAWDEKVIDQPATEEVRYDVWDCLLCEYETSGDITDHMNRRHPNQTRSYVRYTKIEPGTPEIYHIIHHEAVYETIHHNEVTEKQWIVDQKAYEEKIVAGYKCSKCGDFKQ